MPYNPAGRTADANQAAVLGVVKMQIANLGLTGAEATTVTLGAVEYEAVKGYLVGETDTLYGLKVEVEGDIGVRVS